MWHKENQERNDPNPDDNEARFFTRVPGRVQDHMGGEAEQQHAQERGQLAQSKECGGCDAVIPLDGLRPRAEIVAEQQAHNFDWVILDLRQIWRCLQVLHNRLTGSVHPVPYKHAEKRDAAVQLRPPVH
mmetsp:Transcript_26892/g.48597  ORF Transcript_26892/g.48597 Transcript_26892/m.48597 type:complete len:129 (+) Transcript_26892:872-1258(+)